MIGLSPNLANEELLRRKEYLGQYGKIKKIAVNMRQVYNYGQHGPSYSAYVTFYSEREATIAIQAIDGFYIESRQLKASYGTTKYCNFFLRDVPCPNSACLYLHEPGPSKESYTKEDMLQNKHLEQKVPSVRVYPQSKLDQNLKTVFPLPASREPKPSRSKT